MKENFFCLDTLCISQFLINKIVENPEPDSEGRHEIEVYYADGTNEKYLLSKGYRLEMAFN